MFIFERERERQSTSRGGAERERETQNPKQAPRSEKAVRTEPDTGLKPANHEIMTWAKVRHLTDWVTQAPLEESFKKAVNKLYTQIISSWIIDWMGKTKTIRLTNNMWVYLYEFWIRKNFLKYGTKAFAIKKIKRSLRGAWVAQLVKCPTTAQVTICGSWVRAPCQALC